MTQTHEDRSHQPAPILKATQRVRSFNGANPADHGSNIGPVQLRQTLGFFLLLLSALTSSKPIVSLAMILTGLGLVAGVAVTKRRIWLPILSYSMLILVLTAVAGSAPLPSLEGDFISFIQGEGRILITMTIYLAVALFLDVRDTSWASLTAAYSAIALTSTIPFVLWWSVGGFSQPGNNVFIFLASSHHAAGILYSLGVLVLLTGQSTPISPGRLASVVILLSCAISTGSRTGLLGLLFAGLYWIAHGLAGRRRSSATMLSAAAIAVSAVLLVGWLAPQTRESVTVLSQPESWSSLSASFRSGRPIGITRQTDTGTANAIIRFAVWGKVTNDVIDSPFVGQGPFRINDSAVFSTHIVPGVLSFKFDGVQQYSDFQAHNLFLNTLADLGLAGLAVVAWFVVSVLRDAHRSPHRREAILLLFFSLGVSLPSNAVLSPIMAVSFMPALCVATYFPRTATVPDHAS